MDIGICRLISYYRSYTEWLQDIFYLACKQNQRSCPTKPGQ